MSRTSKTIRTFHGVTIVYHPGCHWLKDACRVFNPLCNFINHDRFTILTRVKLWICYGLCNCKAVKYSTNVFQSLTIRVIQKSVELPPQEKMPICGSGGVGRGWRVAHAVFGKNLSKQNKTTYRPLFHVPTVHGGGGYGTGWRLWSWGGCGPTSPPVNRLTDACENITGDNNRFSPQLRPSPRLGNPGSATDVPRLLSILL